MTSPQVFLQSLGLLINVCKENPFILLLEDILHKLIGSLSHYLQGCLHPKGGCLGFLPSTVAIHFRKIVWSSHHSQIHLWMFTMCFSPQPVLRSILALPRFFLASRCQRIIIHLTWSYQRTSKLGELFRYSGLGVQFSGSCWRFLRCYSYQLSLHPRSLTYHIPWKEKKSERKGLSSKTSKGSKRHRLHSKHGSVGKKHLTPLKTNMTMEKQPWMKMYLPLKMVIFYCHVSSSHGSGVFRSISTSKWMVGILAFLLGFGLFSGANFCCYRGCCPRDAPPGWEANMSSMDLRADEDYLGILWSTCKCGWIDLLDLDPMRNKALIAGPIYGTTMVNPLLRPYLSWGYLTWG